MPAEPRITDRDLELLSAYIDGELSTAERSELEARLEREPQLQRELRTLRQTVELVRLMPRLRAPRDFTLTPEMVRPPRVLIFPATAAFSALSAVAAALFILVGVLLLVQRDSTLTGELALAPATSEAVALAPTLSVEETLPVPQAGLTALEAEQEASGPAILSQPEGAPLPQATLPMAPAAIPQVMPGDGLGSGGAAGDSLAPNARSPEMFAPPVDSFAQSEGMYDMSEPRSAPFLPTTALETDMEVDDTASARSAAPGDGMADLMMAVPAGEATGETETAEEAVGIMMAVPEAEATEAPAQVAQAASPTATLTPTEEPMPTPTATPEPTPTATPTPLIPVSEHSAGILGIVFILLGIVAFGLFALAQAARRRRG